METAIPEDELLMTRFARRRHPGRDAAETSPRQKFHRRRRRRRRRSRAARIVRCELNAASAPELSKKQRQHFQRSLPSP